MKFQLTIVLLVCLSVALAERYSSRFASFRARHGKKYSNQQEEKKRYFGLTLKKNSSQFNLIKFKILQIRQIYQKCR